MKKSIGIIIFLAVTLSGYAQELASFKEGASYYNFVKSSLNYKYETINADKPIVIRVKARANLDVFAYASMKGEGKAPKTFTREVKGNYYEIHVIPSAPGNVYLSIGARGTEYKAAYKNIMSYTVQFSKGGYAFDQYIMNLPARPSQKFYDLGLTDSDILFKKVGLKANGSEKVVSLKYKGNVSLYGHSRGNCTSVEQKSMVNGVSSVRVVGKKIGWSQVKFFLKKRTPYVYGYNKDGYKSSPVLTYWVYFSDTISYKRWYKKRAKQFGLPTEQEYKYDEEYDYTSIDEYVKNIPQGYDRTMGAVCDYVNQKARNDRERVRGVYTWMCNNIKYSLDASSTPDIAFTESRKTYCAGYSRMFKGFMDIMGIESNYLSGYVLDSRFTPNSPGSHAWSGVVIDGKWRLLDVTWGRFFTRPEKFVLSHYPTSTYNDFQMLKNPITEEEYKARDYSRIYNGYDVSLHQGILSRYEFNSTIENLEGVEYVHVVKGVSFGSDRFNKSGKSLNFNGYNTHMEIEPYELDEFTISMWVYVPTDAKEDMPLINKVNSNGRIILNLSLSRGVSPRFNYVDIVDGKRKLVNLYGKTLARGRWQHIVITKKGKHLQLSVNFKSYGHQKTKGVHDQSNENISIGKSVEHYSKKESYFKGKIDDLRIYKRALKRSEIGKLFYENGFKGKFGDHY